MWVAGCLFAGVGVERDVVAACVQFHLAAEQVSPLFLYIYDVYIYLIQSAYTRP